MTDSIVLDDSASAERRRRIYNILENTTQTAFKLEQSWIRLGVMLSEFKNAEDWRPLGYTTFDDFMEELKVKFNRGRTQLWGYLSVAEHLLPIISADKLEEMGIAKALELKRAKKRLDGKPLPEALINAALGNNAETGRPTTAKELRGEIGKALNLEPETAGTWFDLDGFFMDKSERAEFKEAFLATEGVLGLKRELPDHIRRKEVILTWMREWFGTHAAEFYGDQKGVETCAPAFINTSVFRGTPEVPGSQGEVLMDYPPETPEEIQELSDIVLAPIPSAPFYELETSTGNDFEPKEF